MATYYVSTLGDNANAGTSPAAAWATLAHAEANATGSHDVIVVMADGVHDVGSGINFTTSTTVVRHVVGADASGTIGAARATIQASAAGAVTLRMPSNSIVSDLIVDAAGETTNGITPGGNCYFLRVDIIAPKVNGTTGSGHLWFYCAAIGCGGIGFSSARHAFRCVAIDNASHGFRGCESQVGCVAIGNGGDGYRLEFNDHAMHCTAHANTGNGFTVAGSNCLQVGCVATGNGGYGWSDANANNPRFSCVAGSGAAANTTGARTATVPNIRYDDAATADIAYLDDVGSIPADIDMRPSAGLASLEGLDLRPPCPIGPGDFIAGAGIPDWNAGAPGGGGGVILPRMRVSGG